MIAHSALETESVGSNPGHSEVVFFWAFFFFFFFLLTSRGSINDIGERPRQTVSGKSKAELGPRSQVHISAPAKFFSHKNPLKTFKTFN